MYIGRHVGVGGGILKGIRKVHNELDGNIAQFYLGSSRSAKRRFRSDEDLVKIKRYSEDNNIKLVVHFAYTLNLARPLVQCEKGIRGCLIDLEYVEKMGGIGVIVHMGKHCEMDREVALKNMRENIREIMKRGGNIRARLILETSSGQGTELCWNLDELSKFYRTLDEEIRERILFCMDTCHVYSAGLDISTRVGVREVFKKWNKLIGIDKIALIHLNDSKNEWFAKVDRHEALTFGHIGFQGLQEVCIVAKENGIPIVMETPEVVYWKHEISLVKKWIK